MSYSAAVEIEFTPKICASLTPKLFDNSVAQKPFDLPTVVPASIMVADLFVPPGANAIVIIAYDSSQTLPECCTNLAQGLNRVGVASLIVDLNVEPSVISKWKVANVPEDNRDTEKRLEFVCDWIIHEALTMNLHLGLFAFDNCFMAAAGVTKVLSKYIKALAVYCETAELQLLEVFKELDIASLVSSHSLPTLTDTIELRGEELGVVQEKRSEKPNPNKSKNQSPVTVVKVVDVEKQMIDSTVQWYEQQLFKMS